MISAGCVSTDFNVETLAKTDINVVADIHIQQTMTLLKHLTRKLYRMNSLELAKVPDATVESRISALFHCPPLPPDPILNRQKGTGALLLALSPEFTGDRVYALVYGLVTMTYSAYNQHCDLFMLDFLSAQDLYNSARNIEILVWRLKTRKNKDGHPLLTTNICEGPVKNLSFERLFGKLISLQDTMARIISTRGDRIVKQVVQSAGMAFFPVGITH